MLQQLSYTEFSQLAQTSQRVAIYREIPADRLTPIQIAENLADLMQDGALFESGRYSLLTFGQMGQLTYQNNVVTQKIGAIQSTHTEHPFTLLRQLLKRFACSNQPPIEHFVPSTLGFIGYDAVRLFESIPDRHPDDGTLPDILFNFYQNTLLFDHVKQTLLIYISKEITDNSPQIYHATQSHIDHIIDKIRTPYNQHRAIRSSICTPTTVDHDDNRFIQMIMAAKQYITAGDAFQIVLSRCFEQAYTATPFEIYRALRHVSPAPYMFYLPVNNSVIVGASPEKLLSVHHKKVEVNPIAGTRPRDANSNDAQITAELLHDPKELAEHMMLVDMARNDVGAVCKPGSVTVPHLLSVKHFSHISHITSTVRGELRNGKDALDAFAATFPAGTLSGAPKIRAMQIIDQLETSKRKLYGGAICQLDHHGNFDSCIAIRTAVLTNGLAKIRTGAGIVFDSIPQNEADETRHKAKAMLAAIALAETGDLCC
jgi:anthranilate synthase component I